MIIYLGIYKFLLLSFLINSLLSRKYHDRFDNKLLSLNRDMRCFVTLVNNLINWQFNLDFNLQFNLQFTLNNDIVTSKSVAFGVSLN